MLKHFTLTIFLLITIAATSQEIRKIAAYDSQSSYTSGVYCISDTAVYRYSWYYQEWFPLESDGLTISNDTVRVSAIAVYNNKTNNSSGIFVFSDSVVLNYNWFVQTWFSLENTGLPRNTQNKPDVYDLAVYGDSGSSSNSKLFALTHSGIFRYEWYYQEWFPLANTGLQVSAINNKSENIEAKIFPNPASFDSKIELTLPENYNGKVEFAFTDMNGKLIMTDIINASGTLVYNIRLNELKQGIYFCEIKAGNDYKAIKMIRL